MSVDELKWLSGLLLPPIAINATLLNPILNDKLRNPLRIAILINLLCCGILSSLAYAVTSNSYVVAVIVIETLILLGGIIFVLKQRDVKGIKLAEEFIEFERMVDVQMSYILTDLVDKKPFDETRKSILYALKYVLDILGEHVGFDNGHQRKNHVHHMSILLVKEDGKFEVLASSGITPSQIRIIETEFTHTPRVVSVAGYAASKRVPVCISDLKAVPNPDDPINYWIKSENNERQEGFLLCYPIKRGVDARLPTPMAIVCLSSRAEKAYDCQDAFQLLDRVAPKIENLIYALQLIP